MSEEHGWHHCRHCGALFARVLQRFRTCLKEQDLLEVMASIAAGDEPAACQGIVKGVRLKDEACTSDFDRASRNCRKAETCSPVCRVPLESDVLTLR